MRYELIIEKTQPPCGGKSARVHEFLEVETEDPMAYVRAREPELELEETKNPDGTLIISCTHGLQQVRYEFTED